MNYDPEGIVDIKRVERRKTERLKNKTKRFNAFMGNFIVCINKNIKI